MSSGVEKTSHMNTTDKIKVSTITASGTAAMIPAMGRRNYIMINNVGGAIVELGGAELMVSGTVGFPVAATNGSWDDNTDAVIYVRSTGVDSELRVYERATR